MDGFAEVKFKGTRRDFFHFDTLDLSPGDPVIVEADRGEDLGRVSAVGNIAMRKCSSSGGCATPTPTKRVLRRAESGEVLRAEGKRADEDYARREVRKQVNHHRLKMKVSEAEWQFDRKKLTIYFTAEKRVDFRALVRDLARTFRTRIELKQISVREEAALLGGVGRCGRELCCSTWLPELKPVSLRVAKDQNLSLNPSQISGCCGRLMCCLMYEHDTYVKARRKFPREGRVLKTSLGKEKVTGLNIFKETVTLEDKEGKQRTLSVENLKREVSASPRG